MRRIVRRLERLEGDHRRVLDRLGTLRGEQLSWRPGAGQWSLLQVLEHLLEGEIQILAGLPEPARLSARPPRLRNRAMHVMVLGALALNLRVPTAAPEMEPTGNRTLAELAVQSEKTRGWLRRYVAESSPEQLRRPVFRHPISGPLDASQALLLGHLHFRAHGREIRRNLALLEV